MVKMSTGQSGTRVKVGKRRIANSGGSSSESSDGKTEQAAISEGRPASRTAALHARAAIAATATGRGERDSGNEDSGDGGGDSDRESSLERNFFS